MKKPNKRLQPEDFSHRQRRVGEEVRHLLSSFLMRGDFYSDNPSSSLITITEVRMSVDLRHAFAFFMPLGGKGIEEALVSLKELAPQMRTFLAKSLRLRVAPMLHFEIDRTFEEVEKLEALLASNHVAQDLKA